MEARVRSLGPPAVHVQGGEVMLDASLYTTEAWLGLVERDPERAAARIETFTERMGRIADVSIPRTVLRSGASAASVPPRRPWRVEALYERLTGRRCPRSDQVDDEALLGLVDRVLSRR
ncbi:MAG: hypothetical protein EA416_08425 [Trueperaceae bacterium]|nr:MAG: hypothetical protein EA416_08425 [Trueperaceae bacterium]